MNDKKEPFGLFLFCKELLDDHRHAEHGPGKEQEVTNDLIDEVLAKQGVEGELQALLEKEQNAHADHDLEHLLPKLVALHVEIHKSRFQHPTDRKGKSAAASLKTVRRILVNDGAACV